MARNHFTNDCHRDRRGSRWVVSTTGCLQLALLPTYMTIDVSFPGWMIRSNCRDWWPWCRFGEGSNDRRANWLAGAGPRPGSYIVRLRSLYALDTRKSTQA